MRGNLFLGLACFGDPDRDRLLAAFHNRARLAAGVQLALLKLAHDLANLGCAAFGHPP